MIPIYWGIFFSNEFLTLLENEIQFPHVTFGFRIEMPDYILGQECTVNVIGYGLDDKNEALLVELPEEVLDIYSGSNKPHITLSVANDGKPVNSGNLEFMEINPWKLSGVFGYFNGSELVFE